MSKVKQLVASLFDGTMTKKRKLVILVIVLYIISPIDFIPDFIPVAGYADDILLPILLLVADKLIDNRFSDNTETESTQKKRQPVN